MYTYLKEDGVSNDPETFSYVMNIYERTCAHTKTNQIALQRGLFSVKHWRTGGLVVSRTPLHMTVLDVLETAVFVR